MLMAIEGTPQGYGQRIGRTPGTLAREEFPVRETHAGRALRPRRIESGGTEKLALGLGWFSIGLGLAQLIAPGAVSRIAGARGRHSGLIRGVGLRELACGAGILARGNPGAWLQARAAGDLMDIALLAPLLRSSNPSRERAISTLAAVIGVTAVDMLVARQLRGRPAFGLRGRFREAGVPVEKSVTVNKPPQECYEFWRNFTNLPRFMRHLRSVQLLDERHSHWVAQAPGGTRVEWDSELTEDVPGQFLAWRSLSGSDVDHSGSVRFEPAPGGRGTIVRVQMRYQPPAGRAGVLVAKLFHEEPQQQVQEDLRRFKQVLETGEIATTRGQPSGRRSLVGRTVRKGERYAR
jgi:uncharacterized membrane protein